MKKPIILLLTLAFFFGCKKKEPESTPLSPANGVYNVQIHEVFTNSSSSDTVNHPNYDTIYSSTMTISGSIDSINIKCIADATGLYVTKNLSTDDTLKYYLYWPPASNQTGIFSFYQQTNSFSMTASYIANHQGKWTYTITKL